MLGCGGVVGAAAVAVVAVAAVVVGSLLRATRNTAVLVSPRFRSSRSGFGRLCSRIGTLVVHSDVVVVGLVWLEISISVVAVGVSR